MTANLVLALLIFVPAIASERLTDKDIKELFERINHDRDRFEDQLDGELKRQVLRGPGGEVDVERFLDDLQENVGRMKDRFSSEYSASAEVTTVLRQASSIHRFMASQPPDFKGASEWNRLAAGLNDLAAAYATRFPIAEGASARRMNDREVQQAAEELAKAADRFKKALDAQLKSDKAVDQATRETALAEVDTVKNAARTVASRLDGGQPASGEAKALIEQFVALRGRPFARSLSAPAQTEWTSIGSQLSTVALGFGLQVPPGETR
jgi:hypothetical protein